MGADTVVVTSVDSSHENVAIPFKEGATATIDAELGLKSNLRDDPDARAEFLATFSATESKAIMAKVDRRFFILIGLMFMVKNMDNANASLIKVLQVGKPSNVMVELKMSSDAYNWVASIYGISYIIFELPSNMVLKYFTPHVWQFRIFFLWGIATACSGAVKTGGQLLACRFLVGLFEAGMFPGVVTGFGFVGLPTNQLLNIPPVAATILGIIFSSWLIGRAYISRPFYIMLMVAGSVLSYVVLITANREGRYAACILGGAFINSFYPPYWSWRAGYVTGSTGAAFALGLQSSFAQLGAVVSPQFYQSRWAHDGYRQSFYICLSMICGAGLSVLYSWWLTRKVESQVLRVRREVLKAKREGREYDGRDDIDILGDETLKNRRLW